MAYCDFAAENTGLWRALFEHRMAPDKPVPEWAVDEQMALFRHIYRPLAALFPNRTANELGVTARSLFSAVHGMVTLGLEQKLIAVPIVALRAEIALIVRAMVRGLEGRSQLLRFVIANEAKQSILPREERMDCFVASAPRNDDPNPSHRQHRRARGLARGEVGVGFGGVFQRVGLVHLDLDRA